MYSLIYLMILLVYRSIQYQMNDKACSVKQSQFILMYYPVIGLEALKKKSKQCDAGWQLSGLR